MEIRFTSLTAFQQLDYILYILRKELPDPRMKISDIMSYITIRCPNVYKELGGRGGFRVYIEEILEHLEGKGHVKITPYTGEYIKGLDDYTFMETEYVITFSGRTFIGYEIERNLNFSENTRLASLENHQKHHRKWMTWLTTILASFAFLSVFLQSLEKFHVLLQIDIWTAFFLYLVGTLTGIIILLIILEVLRKSINTKESK